MEKIYYKNDFKLQLDITSGTESVIPDWNYELVFTTTGSRLYKCSYKDEIYKNMAVEDGKIWCYFNNHNLALGILKCLYISLYADSDFSDNDRKEIIISDLDVELVTDENDTTTPTVLTLPTTIKWLANKTYLVSIINNCATLKGGE